MKLQKSTTAAFSGHRELSGGSSLFGGMTPEDIPAKLDNILSTLIERGFRTFLCGMAEGFDMLAGEAVLRAREAGKPVSLIAVIPFTGQAKGFSEEDTTRYATLREAADSRIILSEEYYKGCYHRRNDFLTDHASCLVCHYTGAPGGTRYTVKRALQLGIDVINTATP